jgi:peptide/nickel transport system substrate-binding protein
MLRAFSKAVLSAFVGVALAGTAGVALAQPEPQHGGTLTIALPRYPVEGLNPQVRGSIGPTQVLRNAFDSLVAADYDENFHPWLAESWERSEDGLVYTFKLRENVTFHDGEPFNAEAVKINFDRITDGVYAPAVARTTFAPIAETRVVDEYTVEVVLREPAGDLLHTLSSLQGAIISPRSLAEDGVEAGGIAVAGTGPFILSEIVDGQELTFVRNPDYDWAPANASHTSPAYVDELVVKFVPKPSVRVGLLTSGEVDVIGEVPPNDIELFRDVDGFHYEQRGSNVVPPSLYFNTTAGPTQDVRVRRALQEAADIDGIIQSVLRGTSDRAWSIVQPQSRYYDPRFEDAYGGDVELANSLLDEAGWTGRDAQGFRTDADGNRLHIRLIATNPGQPLDTILQAYQAELRENAGVEIDLQFRDEGTVDRVREANEYEIFPRSIGGVFPGDVLTKVYHSTGAINGPRLADPEIDALLEESRRALTEDDRKALYDQLAQFALIDEATTLPLYTDRYSVAGKDSVHDIGAFIDPPRGLVNGWAYNTWIEQ